MSFLQAVILLAQSTPILAPSLMTAKLKGMDVRIFVVGVGDKVNVPMLRDVATKPDFFHHVDSFKSLPNTVPALSAQVCNTSEGKPSFMSCKVHKTLTGFISVILFQYV